MQKLGYERSALFTAAVMDSLYTHLPKRGGRFAYEEMQGDHIVPWSKGGKTVPENLQTLCRRCNNLKRDR